MLPDATGLILQNMPHTMRQKPNVRGFVLNMLIEVWPLLLVDSAVTVYRAYCDLPCKNLIECMKTASEQTLDICATEQASK